MAKDKNQIDDLVDTLDNMFAEGVGHVNVLFDENKDEKTVQTVKANECGINKGACMQPTELDINE